MFLLHKCLSVYSTSHSLDVLQRHFGNHLCVDEAHGMKHCRLSLRDYLQSMGSLPDRRLDFYFPTLSPLIVISFGLFPHGSFLQHNGDSEKRYVPSDRLSDKIGVRIHLETLPQQTNGSLAHLNGNSPHGHNGYHQNGIAHHDYHRNGHHGQGNNGHDPSEKQNGNGHCPSPVLRGTEFYLELFLDTLEATLKKEDELFLAREQRKYALVPLS